MTKAAHKEKALDMGSVRVLVFKDGNDWYATALELNIAESGSTPREALLLLFEAVQGYAEAAKKIRFGSHLLNQPVDPEYEARWHNALENKNKEEPVFFAGKMNIGRKAAMLSV